MLTGLLKNCEYIRTAEVGDSEALTVEAKELTKKYLRAGPKGKWLLSTPTYRSLYRLPDFKSACRRFGKVTILEIKQVEIISGVLVAVTVVATFEGKLARFRMSLLREKGKREPDINAPLRVNAKTAPPFLFVNARE